ncbi:hypothetical protein VN24_12830 [Paenibacillus beijingensis]|uniref:Uncharacterized protein n=1 Tax=Paenibacillus beijingensis TaxID=1126833 RepID=A0A0D5NJ62_9BACL|nr:hypothetical protein VN24_12830 [Paenibacillus beijingensis]
METACAVRFTDGTSRLWFEALWRQPHIGGRPIVQRVGFARLRSASPVRPPTASIRPPARPGSLSR